MNVVGKVGNLITQGVYTVATPFHPFGGAVDGIVVQQQDGTFRSTPWYVRFGKFQGVLKGAEKIVRIYVNGVEANFHMYLDNSGEAYFVKEVDDDKGIDSNVEHSTNAELNREDCDMEFDIKSNSNVSFDDTHGQRLDHTVSDSRVLQLKDEDDSSRLSQLQRAESDSDHRYYEFQEEQSFEGSAELSEYGSNRYENLDGEKFVDSQGSHSGVVLVSVDGHILTAPISESEQDTEDVQLRTPQFHLGPGEGTDFVEGNEEFISGENAWAADYISKLDASTTDVAISNHCNTNGDDNIHICHEHKTFQTENEEDLHMQSNRDEVTVGIKREVVFKSCLELQELAQQVGDSGSPNASSPLQVQYPTEDSNVNCPEVGDNELGSIPQSKNIDKLSPSIDSASPSGNRSPHSELGLLEVEKKASEVGDTGSGSCSVTNDPECNGEHIGGSASIEGADDNQQTPAVEDDSTKSELVEPHIGTYSEGDQSHSGLEISLCGHELKAGMGVVAAAEVFEAHRISAEVFRGSASSIIKNENLVIKFRETYLPWEKAAPLVLGMTAFGLELPIEPKDTIPVEQDDALKSRGDDPGSSSSGRRWRLWPIPFRKVKTLEHTSSNSSNEEIFVDSESVLQNPLVESSPTSAGHRSPRKQLVRTNVPTSDQIASLNLKEGQNFITFSFSTRVLGTQQVDAHIYLWKWNARIVISDVDGTITKSDVLGQFMPLVGKDWAQSGVARLFSAIKENGYQLLFLSARAIVQAYLTRSFLLNLKQDGKALPNGPVVISPDGLFPSLFREVIRRAPHEFKIACLEDIKRLFPSDYNPFYAGFGNRDTDELSYRKIGIPKGKIFIINPKGEVAISSHRIDVKSYTSLHTLVNDMFPPTSLVEQEDFNSWNYWKMPLPDIE